MSGLPAATAYATLLPVIGAMVTSPVPFTANRGNRDDYGTPVVPPAPKLRPVNPAAITGVRRIVLRPGEPWPRVGPSRELASALAHFHAFRPSRLPSKSSGTAMPNALATFTSVRTEGFRRPSSKSPK